MRRYFASTLLCLCRWGWWAMLVVAGIPAAAAPFAWDAQSLPSHSLGQQVQVLREYDQRWSPAQALARFEEINPAPRRDEVLSFGISTTPVWLHLPLHNNQWEPLRMQLLLGTTWLDHADVFVLKGNKLRSSWQLGDEAPYAYGVVPGMGYHWELELPPGHSNLLVRVQSYDPLILPLQLLDSESWQAQRESVHYSYELMLGALFALVLYNLALFAVARNSLHGLYALYIGCMLWMCLAYTGAGLALWWPQSPYFQRYVILSAMLLFNASGLSFAERFLGLAWQFPRVVVVLRTAMGAALLAMVVLVQQDLHAAAVWWAFSVFLASTLTLWMWGAWAVWSRKRGGGLFFVAVNFSVLGAITTWLVVMGLVEYSTWAFRALEFSFLIEACLLAVALGRKVLEEKTPPAATGTHPPPSTVRSD